MPRVVHFEIPADQPQRAADFYGKVFGWQITKWEGPQEYWLVRTGEGDEPGIDGGLLRREQPGAGTVNTINVPSLDRYVESVKRHGGTISVPKMAIPGIGWLAYCQDPEGNLFGLMEAEESAA